MVEDPWMSARKSPDGLVPRIEGVRTGPPHEGDTGQGLVFDTDQGEVSAILHEGTGAEERGVVWAWGAGGGYRGPAEGIFANLADEFTSQRITSLRVNYRHPSAFAESVGDVLCGLEFLRTRGISRVALVGHSFGGAVVIGAALYSSQVVAVVSLSPQTYGARGVAAVSPRPILIVHGLDDKHLTPRCAQHIHNWARDPKELVLYPGADHGLRECKDELHDLLRRWIPEKLSVGSKGTDGASEP